MVRHALKILQQILQDFESVPDHFGTLCINRLNIRQLNPPKTFQCLKNVRKGFLVPIADEEKK